MLTSKSSCSRQQSSPKRILPRCQAMRHLAANPNETFGNSAIVQLPRTVPVGPSRPFSYLDHQGLHGMPAVHRHTQGACERLGRSASADPHDCVKFVMASSRSAMTSPTGDMVATLTSGFSKVW